MALYACHLHQCSSAVSEVTCTISHASISPEFRAKPGKSASNGACAAGECCPTDEGLDGGALTSGRLEPSAPCDACGSSHLPIAGSCQQASKD